MKKLFVAISVIGLLALTSCGTGGGLGAGSWSYKGVTYSAIAAVGSTTAKTLTATTASTSEVDDVVFRFNAYPPAAGSYTVVNNPSPGPTEVYVIANVGTKAFTVDVSGGVSATVTLSGSHVSVTVPSVTFSNVTGQTVDSGPFTASVNQTL